MIFRLKNIRVAEFKSGFILYELEQVELSEVYHVSGHTHANYRD